MGPILNRQELTNIWTKRFEKFNEGYFITLNSKKAVSSLFDYRAPLRIIELDAEMQNIHNHLNEFCFGRKFLRHEVGSRLNCLAAYEIGTENGMIHAHILAAHDGTTNRSVSEVTKHLNAKWGKVYQFDGSNSFVNVQELGRASDRIWYMTKQSEHFQRRFGELNLTMH